MKNAQGDTADQLIGELYDDESRTALLRFLKLSEGDEFHIAAVEVPSPMAREALLSWLRVRNPSQQFLEVSLRRPFGGSLAEALAEAAGPVGLNEGTRCIALTELELTDEAATASHPRVFMRLNVERDALVHSLRARCLLLAHPVALLKLRSIAPDFCAYFSLLVTCREEALAAPVPEREGSRLSTSAMLSLADADWPSLLREADLAHTRCQYDRMRDNLAAFVASRQSEEWEAEVSLLRLALTLAERGAHEARVECAEHVVNGRVITRVRRALLCALIHQRLGDPEAEAASIRAAADDARASEDPLPTAEVLLEEGRRLARRGRVDEALRNLDEAAGLFVRAERRRDAWIARAQRVAIEAQSNHGDKAAEEISRLIVEARDVLRDDLLTAMGERLRAREFSARGDHDGALRVLREAVLPVFERSGDWEDAISTRGQIAEVQQSRGDLDEAIQILRGEVLPGFERLGHAREAAVTRANVGDLLSRKGRHAEAFSTLEAALRSLEQLRLPRERAQCSLTLAEAHHRSGGVLLALREVTTAMSLAESLRDPSLLRDAADLQARLLFALGRAKEIPAVFDRVGHILAEDARWSELSKLDALRHRFARPPSPPVPPPRRKR
ncbi:MAG: hypothetical protein U0325_16385 [Polyangiales bacterium]